MNSNGQPPTARIASTAELRLLYRTLVQRTEEERARVAQQIHNELGQSLTAIKMALRGAQRQVNAGQATERLQLAESLLDETIQTARRIAADLRPGLLDHFGLGAAVEWQMQQFSTHAGRPHRLQMALDENQITPAMATVAFRILQEALATINQVDAITAVNVDLTMPTGVLRLTIQAMTQAASPRSSAWPDLAVLGMQERAQPIGGRVELVAGTSDEGTRLMLWLPLRQAVEDVA